MTIQQNQGVDISAVGAIFSVNNPYWEEIKEAIGNDILMGGDVVRRWSLNGEFALRRQEFVHRYSWTVPDPDTLLFVAAWCGGKIIDPLAGTGYWAYLLDQMSIDVIAYDKEPDDNTWHPEKYERFFEVLKEEAVFSVALHPDRTLFLSWVPYGYPGDRIINAYKGDRIVYIGEGEYGCCGDDSMFACLEENWKEVESHRPVQWDGMHDYVTIYDRKKK